MVNYIRFLKPPKPSLTHHTHVTVKALITITNDLGDEFYQGDLILIAELSSSYETPCTQSNVVWKSGMRALWIVIELVPGDRPWPTRLHVTTRAGIAKTITLSDIPDVLGAWSDHFDLHAHQEADKRVERRFNFVPDGPLSIFEETGESIARHIW